MATFKDIQGRAWTIALDIPSIMKIRKEVDPEFLKNDFEQSPGRVPTIMRLRQDPVLTAQIAFLLTEESRTTDGYGPDAFYKAVVGDALGEAENAIVTAIIAFSSGTHRDLQKGLANQAKIMDDASARMAAKLCDPQVVGEAMAAFEKQLDTDLQRVLHSLPSVAAAQPSTA